MKKEQIHIRISEILKQQLRAKAAAASKTMSEYILDLIKRDLNN